LLIYFH